MLSYYQTQTQRLLQNPAAPATLYPTSDLTSYINTARGQVAGEGRCIRAIGTLSTIIAQRNYSFSSISFGTVATTGIQGAINMRAMLYNVGSGQKWVKNKSWEWFQLYRMNNPVPNSGPPSEWAQLGQGSAGQGAITNAGAGSIVSGSFYVDPLPDQIYTFNCDCTCYPQALTLDTDVEAIPYLWTDAVPYFAAYLALMSAQTSSRMQQAQNLFALYEQFMARARDMANPDVNTFSYAQSQDLAKQNRFGSSGQPG